ncbi:hypothetical protein BH24CHL6_BH24CHL6_09880 [soil metagenome]
MAVRRHALPPFSMFLACLLAVSTAAAPTASARPAEPAGFRALSGAAARSFRAPDDTRRTQSLRLDRLNLTVERYQQFATRFEAAVDGAQLTVVRRDGEPVLVVGAHFPGVNAVNRPLLDETAAISLVVADDSLQPGEQGEHAGEIDPPEAGLEDELSRWAGLWLDPESGRLFYRVETSGLAVRQFHTIDAQTGRLIAAWDALAHDHGTGVKGDRKKLTGGPGPADNLTRNDGGAWRMRSMDSRLITYDMANRWGGPLAVARDADNQWTLSRQRSTVDAQYYARATDDFLLRRFGFDVLSASCGYGQIQSIVRYGKNYANAFWNGSQLVYGEGDGLNFRALSGAHDVVAHELTHAVTECTSDLAYLNESGALNEAFSDIVATAAEFELDEPLNSRCRRAAGQAGCPDWWIGEDVWRGAAGHGIRSLTDPTAASQPAHYDQRYTGSADNGGVHINSGIAAHAFYLMSEGGPNARCDGSAGPQADCDVVVPGLGLADAQTIAFVAYTSLPSKANFCDARWATVATAEALQPGSIRHAAAAALSWSAVGVTAGACPPAQSDFTIQLDQRSLYLAPAVREELSVSLTRGSETGDIAFTIDGLPVEWYEVQPSSSAGPSGGGTTLSLKLPSDVSSGIHPFSLSATSASRTERVHGLLMVDAAAPVVSLTPPSLALGARVPSDGATLPVTLHWSASDVGSGLVDARLEWRVDGGEWQDVTPPAGPAAALVLQLGAGAHSFRAQAVDGVGNRAITEASQPIGLAGWQESEATYSAGWSALSAVQAWGTARSTTQAQRQAMFSFSGSEVAWVAHRGPRQGRARVYVDGVLAAKVDLYARKVAARTVVFRAADLGPDTEHTLTIVALGTAGRPRVSVDGFVVLSR